MRSVSLPIPHPPSSQNPSPEASPRASGVPGVRHHSAFATDVPPATASRVHSSRYQWNDEEWLTRRNRAAAPASSDESPEAVARRAKAKEKTARAREDAVRAGVAGLTDWLGDVAGAGLAGLPARDAAWWHSIQARMVDAQAKGLASAVDEVRGIVAAGGPRWAHDVADRLGGLHLLARLSSSPDAVVRRRLGFSVGEDEVRTGPGWSDQWAPLLKLESDDGLVRTVRQWAWGRAHGWVVAVRHLGGGGAAEPEDPAARSVKLRAPVARGNPSRRSRSCSRRFPTPRKPPRRGLRRYRRSRYGSAAEARPRHGWLKS